ncbi:MULTISPECIES: DUF3800 domain-containing protein [Corynebacterium]|uniref:DUF3800 domain-containing protein n=1 Tax=Corynebacterium TaxID=1716 RepID=UPI0006660E36|nr:MULTISPECIES: DUF3800 domain-containing protein [Corynebacterium]AYX81309.1 hypothetical protein EGX79_03390 [Corynebacterium jeikeium]KAA9225817.1 DUF3800 domain-containing protein [Corynebacterium amycolatum]KAA9245006.1 DUF3800 domain-containing protein [Corynebacterium amycolatum]MBC6806701.1 hypothetical protein [Corynebacterium sp. LK30]MBC6822348.1 hypothetical protein [Corynebacterium sp. LK33]
MAKRVYLYADETGNLDYTGTPNPQGGGASTYFGFGTATFSTDHHGDNLLQGLHLRAQCAKQNMKLTRGFHAVDDSARTRNEMFQEIKRQAPRFDTTFLYKSNAYESVKQAGPMRLYKMAWYLHLKEIALQVSRPEDELFVIVAEFGTKGIRKAAFEAVHDVCQQIKRNITLCVWTSQSAWGLQVADYGLWAVQRHLEGKKCSWYKPCIEPTLASTFTPWGMP